MKTHTMSIREFDAAIACMKADVESGHGRLRATSVERIDGILSITVETEETLADGDTVFGTVQAATRTVRMFERIFVDLPPEEFERNYVSTMESLRLVSESEMGRHIAAEVERLVCTEGL